MSEVRNSVTWVYGWPIDIVRLLMLRQRISRHCGCASAHSSHFVGHYFRRKMHLSSEAYRTTKISAKESGGITEAISLCTLIIFTLVALNVHFRHVSKWRYLCSGMDRRPMSVMNAPMHSRNGEKCAGATSTISQCTQDIYTPVSMNFTCF
jgi:hypothetical protein